ncbi:MAG: Hsp33 family molecular chaperone HslO [Pseudomonadota bacterium]|nr:Hsp33 family molecular chaperone HslO [Pseudomonadota bacterium]
MNNSLQNPMTVFLLPEAGVRGAHVRLDSAWQCIAGKNDANGKTLELLGQAIAATALLTAHIKIDGRLSVQLRAPGDLRSLFAECTAQGTLRGLIRSAEDANPAQLEAIAQDLRLAGEGAIIAITIENPSPSGEPMRYQGLVPLENPTLAEAFEHYFQRSEQLPTRLLLAADAQHASGLLLQKLPGETTADADGWARTQQLFATLGAQELQTTDAATLLHRLFHQENLQLLGQRPLNFGCSCSRSRVEEMLRSLGREEAEAAVAAGSKGQAEIRCEFCAERYYFSLSDVAALFTAPAATSDAPSRLQ